MRTQMIAMVCLAMASGGSAAAQSVADRAAAEQLFQDGRALMKQRDFAAACPKLEASFALDPALGTQLNLAACYEHIDRPASAWTHYREVADRAQQAGQTSRAELARARAAVVEARVPRLLVRVPDEVRVPGLVVTRDQTTLAPALFDTPLYVDPGDHHVRATAPGRQPFALAVRVAAGEVRVVEVRLPAPAPGPVASGDGPGAPARDAPARVPGPKVGAGAEVLVMRDPGRWSWVAASPVEARRRALVMALGGTAGLALGLTMGWTARRTADELLDGPCDRTTGTCMDDQALARLERTRSQAFEGTLVAAGGVLLLGAGATLYWAARDRGGDTRQTRVLPTAGADGLGLAVMGRF